MTAADRLRGLVEHLPAGASVVLPASELAELLREIGRSEPAAALGAVGADLTVQDVARMFGRSPSTIRGWITSGRLEAYRLAGRELRIERAALDRYLADERASARARPSSRPSRTRSGTTDLRSWRAVRAAGK